MTDRSLAPVFVVGSPRSGTTLLYHQLLSAGGFAVYHAETHVFNLLAPRFGHLASRRHRDALLDAWLPSEFFRRSGLDAGNFRERVHASGTSASALLRLFMEAIAERQGVRRWAECTPENGLFAAQIAREMPDALFLHIVRDGRDVACSLAEQGWVRPGRFGDPADRIVRAALYWEWIVTRTRRNLAPLGDRAMEVRFESLLGDPAGTLEAIGAFLQHRIDYARVTEHGVGTVRRPNTSFPDDGVGAFQPIGRWRHQLSAGMLARLEAVTGATLADLGYALQADPAARRAAARELPFVRLLTRGRFAARHLLKTRTPLGRYFTSTALLRDFRAFDRERLQPRERMHGA